MRSSGGQGNPPLAKDGFGRKIVVLQTITGFDRIGEENAFAVLARATALAQQGRVVARFSPSVDGEPIPFDLEDLYSPFWGLDRYERPGPTITVYELPPH